MADARKGSGRHTAAPGNVHDRIGTLLQVLLTCGKYAGLERTFCSQSNNLGTISCRAALAGLEWARFTRRRDAYQHQVALKQHRSHVYRRAPGTKRYAISFSAKGKERLQDIVTIRRVDFTESERAFIERQRVARLATSDAQGHPTLVPVCYAFDGQRFYTPLDEKPKRVEARQLKRARNIEARHEASLLIDHYADDWTQLGYVLICGRAEIVPPGHPLHARALPLLRVRYAQYRTMALERLPVIVITPQRVSTWGSVLVPPS